MQQLLWLETLLKLVSGLLLLLAPATTITLAGLGPSGPTFWPRLLGATLVALAAATYIEGAFPGSAGLGLAGLLILNVSASAVLAAKTILPPGWPTRRGRWVAWAIIATLVILTFLETFHL